MRIGIDGRLWNETGVGRYIRALFKYLPKDQEFVWFFGKKEFKSVEMPPKWKKVLVDIHWHTLREQLVLPWIFARENLDLLHFPYFSFPILYPGRFVITIHDLIFDHYKTGKWSTLPGWLYDIKKLGYHLVNWISVFRAEKIFTLSNDAKNELISHYQASPNKVAVIYESGKLEAVGSVGKSPMPGPYLLYVGNAHPHKNIGALIKAAEILKMKLAIVGYDQFFQSRLPKSPYVTVVGEVPNNKIADWYRHAAALVTASKMEGFGIPPLEAMSVGCPAIVSDIPVFHEVYGDAAIYFNQNDPHDIARVIKETLVDKKLISTQTKKGYAQAAKYSWERCVKQTFGVYEAAA
ncbi:MAG: glycosyltransferase family 4 protein [Patescibacteria group bacterium]|nr:glycosyltransferase family 4 protein [Patescibacteria group bacterium]MCL5431706.1 glycosyltransferase family 4 protein [Patescibacteria group bacterium]